MSTGLLDVAPSDDTITLGGEAYPVRGVSVRKIAHLLRRYPNLRRLFSGLDSGPDGIADMLDAIPAILAAGVVSDSSAPDLEARFDELPIEDLLDGLNRVLKATMPGGIDPLANRLAELGVTVSGASANGQAAI